MSNEDAIDVKMPTEWFISGNPKYYDVIGAFRKLGKVDWKQSTNVSEGDIVYIYVSDSIQAVRFKCRANKVNIEEPDIDDSEFNVSGEYDGTYGRYMELEMLEEFLWPAFSRKTLENYGFSSPQSPVRVPEQVKTYMDLIQKLKHSEEMDPDKYDGTYELVRETIKSYAEMEDLGVCDYKDLNLVYLMTVGTWRHKVPAKKKTVDESHLPELSKNKLKTLLDTVWTRGNNKEYGNGEGAFGMFGTGFYTFEGKTDDVSPRNFIQACVDILDIDDDEQIFDRMSKVLNESYRGMKAASASMVLHCLKPFTFPIFNSNMGSDNIYVYLGISLDKKTEVYTYIKNCREVKKFRDENFTIKNYRIFDIAAWSLGGSTSKTDIDYIGVLDYLENNKDIPYSNPEATGISAAEKERLLEVKRKGQSALAEIKKMVAICKEQFELDRCEPMSWLDGSNTKTRKYLWAQMKYSQYGDSPISISIFAEMSDTTDKTRYRFSLEIKNDSSDKIKMEKYHSYLDLPLAEESSLVYVSGSNEFGAMQIIDEPVDVIKQKINDGTYKKVQLSRVLEWTDELTNDDCESVMLEAVEALIPYYEHVLGIEKVAEVLEEMDSSNIDTSKTVDQSIEFDKNLILYGPPGTGKTYNSAIYAVAICDGKSIEELTDYDAVMARYNELKKERRIAFTTFHQSYGYEEFIEGIKPVVGSGEQSNAGGNVSYKIEPGIFKEFCETARKAKVKTDKFEIPDDTTIWKATVRSVVREDCFKNNRVRIDWGMDAEGAYGFVNDMKSGDIILTTDGSRSVINGIGVITRDDAYPLDVENDATTRDVMWLATDICEDIRGINNDKMLHRMTVARVPGMQLSDIMALAKSHNPELSNTKIEENEKPYVFIVDEINRGNISKIFGELITLIENTKREGMPEAANAILPYSGEVFSVPQNVYILGTMNTADRSIALMDTALRRRFSFVEMMPETNVLRAIGADKVEGLNVADMLDVINERIAFLYDREHTIGHAFFTVLKDDPSIERLQSIFEKSVIPLLQEYFYEDYQKIQMVFGDNAKENPDLKFILDEKVVVKSIFKGNVEDVIDLPEKKYSINKKALSNIQSYIEIM